MAESHTLGQNGEEQAVKLLENKGYKIRQRNWKAGKHEIDIIAEKYDCIAFIEVKTRSDNFRMHPATAVTTEKQRSIIFAADNYIQRYGIDKECRFDIITVIAKGNNFEIDHIEDAFYPTLR